MPRNGSGTYTLPQSAFVTGTAIDPSKVNSDFSDIATALTASVAADGQTPMTGSLDMDGNNIVMGGGSITEVANITGWTGSLNMNSQRITNIANGTASTDAVAYGQFPTSGADPGYVGFPGGIYAQYGSTTAGSGATAPIAVTFPHAFGTVCLAVSMTTNMATGTPNVARFACLNAAPTTAGFAGNSFSSASTYAPSSTVYWVAFGY